MEGYSQALWFRGNLLAKIKGMAREGSVGEALSQVSKRAKQRREAELGEGLSGQQFGPCTKRGDETGPDPTNRGKKGVKRHILSEKQGIPLAIVISGANVHDMKVAEYLVDTVKPVKGKRGRPRKRVKELEGDKGYDSANFRRGLRQRGIKPNIERRQWGWEEGKSEKSQRWKEERTFSWLNQFRRLKVRYERLGKMYLAFLLLACGVICARTLLQL